MAVQTQSGGNSMLWWGRQAAQTAYNPKNINSKRYVPITNAPTDKGGASTTLGAGHIIHKRFAFTGLGLALASEQSTSATIVGRSSSVKRSSGQLWCEGDITTEMLADDILHYHRVIQNVTPVSAVVAGAAAVVQTGVALSYTNNVLSYPSQVILPKDSLATADVVEIIGTRKIGLSNDEVRPIREVLTITDGTVDKKSTKYFNSISSIEKTTGTGDIAIGDLAFDTGTHKNTIDGFGDNLSEGVTVMERIGLVPHVAYDVLFNTFGVEISDSIIATIGCIGGPFYPRRMIETGTAEQLVIPSNSKWLNGAHYPLTDLNFQPAWGSLLQFGGDIVDVISGGVAINLNLESKQYYRSSRFRNKPKRSTTPREITAAPTVFFESGDAAADVFLRWEDIYIDNETSDMTLNLYNWLDNGRQFRIQYSVKAMQLVEVPTVTAEDAADIERVLSFLSTETPEIKVEVWGNEYKE